MLGATLFPDQRESTNVPPPQPRENRVQISTYGAPIPIVYESARLAGNIIAMSDVQETVEVYKYRVEGQRVRDYTKLYTATFAIAVCEGPVIGISRIWVNGKIFVDFRDPDSPYYPTGSGSMSAGNLDTSLARQTTYFQVYTGTETQEADPTLAAIFGSSNTPAYRGVCYVVFKDFPVGEFNGIPNIEFEVGLINIEFDYTLVQQLGSAGYVNSICCVTDGDGNQIVLAGTDDGKIYRSSDGGDSFAINSTLDTSNIISIIDLGDGALLAGVGPNGKIFESSNYGSSWSEQVALPSQVYVYSLCNINGSIILAGTSGTSNPGIYRTTNGGGSWGLAYTIGHVTKAIVYCGNGICIAGSQYNSTTGRIYRSTNYGADWTLVKEYGSDICSLCYLGNGLILAGTAGGAAVLKSYDYGLTWSLVGALGTETHVWALDYFGNGIVLAGTYNHAYIYRSNDYGETWSQVMRIGAESYAMAMAHFGYTSLIGTGSGRYIYKS